MKKYVVFFIIFCFLLLSACGTKETLDQSTVLTNASEAVETLDSYSINMSIHSDAMGMKTTIEGSGDITHNPDTMYVMMNMGMPGMTMDFETYVQEEEAYMSMFGEWFTMDTEEMGLESFDQLTKEEMEKFVRFSEQFEMTEEGNQYVLTLSGEGDEYSEFVEEVVQSSMGDFPADPTMDEFIKSITVNHLDLEVRIDKETFIMMSQTISADLEIEEAEVSTPMQLQGEFTISNINEVEPIVIPEEVKENAVDDFMGGLLEPMSIEEIQELVDFTIPQVTALPEGYNLSESLYDEAIGMVMMDYGKDFENGFMLSVYPSEEEYGEIPFDETTETVTINGNDAALYDLDEFFILTWEQNGLFLELMGGGPDINKDQFVELAESVQ